MNEQVSGTEVLTLWWSTFHSDTTLAVEWTLTYYTVTNWLMSSSHGPSDGCPLPRVTPSPWVYSVSIDEACHCLDAATPSWNVWELASPACFVYLPFSSSLFFVRMWPCAVDRTLETRLLTNSFKQWLCNKVFVSQEFKDTMSRVLVPVSSEAMPRYFSLVGFDWRVSLAHINQTHTLASKTTGLLKDSMAPCS